MGPAEATQQAGPLTSDRTVPSTATCSIQDSVHDNPVTTLIDVNDVGKAHTASLIVQGGEMGSRIIAPILVKLKHMRPFLLMYDNVQYAQYFG